MFVAFFVLVIVDASGLSGDRQINKFFIMTALFSWAALTFLSVCLVFFLRCPVCRKRIAVIKNNNELSQDYVAQMKNRPLRERIIEFFWPCELRTGITYCAHCNQTYHVRWSQEDAL